MGGVFLVTFDFKRTNKQASHTIIRFEFCMLKPKLEESNWKESQHIHALIEIKTRFIN